MENDDYFIKSDKKYNFRINGPAGLSRADLMYRWDSVSTTKAKGKCKCMLCHTKLPSGTRIRAYKEHGKRYVADEVCFFTYYDIIHPAVA